MEKFKVFVWQILLVISKEEQEKKQEQKKEEDEKKYDNNNFMRVGTFSVMIVFFFVNLMKPYKMAAIFLFVAFKFYHFFYIKDGEVELNRTKDRRNSISFSIFWQPFFMN